MKLEATDEGRRWLLQAKQDLDDARYNSEGERYNIACFLSQQSAEKALKAFLYAEGGEMIWGHSVAELCKRATSVDKEWGIPSEAFEKRDADRAIEIAEEVIKVIEVKL
jgi:HEPN domain-containing protein